MDLFILGYAVDPSLNNVDVMKDKLVSSKPIDEAETPEDSNIICFNSNVDIESLSLGKNISGFIKLNIL